MSKQVKIDLMELCGKFNLKLIYICYQTRLNELLVSEDDYNRLFYLDSDDFEFTLHDSLRRMRLSNKRIGSGKFVLGSFGKIIDNQMIYDVEIAGSIEDLKNNVKIGSQVINDFLTKIEKNERTEESILFAKSKQYYIQPQKIAVEFDGIKSFSEFNSYKGDKQELYRMKKDSTIEKTLCYPLRVELNHLKSTDSLKLDFVIKTNTENLIQDSAFRFEKINGNVYFRDSKNEWFNDINYLKTYKLRETRQKLQEISNLKNAIDLCPDNKEIFEL